MIPKATYRSIWDLLLQVHPSGFSERQIAEAHHVSRSAVRRVKRDLAAYCSRAAIERDYGASVTATPATKGE